MITFMPFKTIKRKIKRGKKVETIKTFREGTEGTGVTLPFGCGFCSTPGAEVRFRSRRQRTNHTQFCPK